MRKKDKIKEREEKKEESKKGGGEKEIEKKYIFLNLLFHCGEIKNMTFDVIKIYFGIMLFILLIFMYKNSCM